VPPEESEAEVTVLEWFRIPVHFTDIATLTRLLDGVLVPSDMEARAPGEIWISQLEWRLRPGSSSGNVLYCNLTIYGLRGDNSILVRATRDDVEELERLIRLLDVPFKQVRVRLSTGPLAASRLVTNGSALRLSDAAGSTRLAAVVVPRVTGDGIIDLQISGTLTAAGVTHPLATRVRVRAGEPARLFTFGGGRRAVDVRVQVSIDSASGPGSR
jgi:hypothetical protein